MAHMKIRERLFPFTGRTLKSKLPLSACFFWLVALLLSPLAGSMQAQYKYITQNGQITITGYTGSGDAVIIPDTINDLPVTGIGAYAFYDCTSLTSMTIGNNVTSVGDAAFIYCDRLTQVTIPNSVTNIGNDAFEYCASLSSVAIGSSVTSIGGLAFFHCYSLTNVTIPNSVITIRDYAFEECTNLASVMLGHSVTSIGKSAFYGCSSLTSVTIPNSVTNIGSWALSGCTSLTAITVEPLNTTYSSLDGVLFNKARNTLIKYPDGKIWAYTVPDSVARIGDGAFSGCWGLTDVFIPSSVTGLGDGAFSYCISMMRAFFAGNAPTRPPFPNATTFQAGVSYECNVTVYYREGTQGWSSIFEDCPTTLWNSMPKIESIQFPPRLTIRSDLKVTNIIEFTDSPGSNPWSVLATIWVTNNPYLFIDISPVQSRRFYRIGASGTGDAVPETNQPLGMSLIPAGAFQRGDAFHEIDNRESPVHTVILSAFYMDQYEVTLGLWNEVYIWAVDHGYKFDNHGSGKAANHPVHTVNWYDAVKWCNARSEKEGRVPAYYTNLSQTSVYRSGQVDITSSWVKWTAGYRLPTDAEWEKAARGGLTGKRFPLGDTISTSQANFYSNWLNGHPEASYDVSERSGWNPTYAVGPYPLTSPVGSFAPNGYGLYDMAGNLWEWCWDAIAAYNGDLQVDPRGPRLTTGYDRVIRGGAWWYHVQSCRVSNRIGLWPDTADYDWGFRTVLPSGQK
jgi:formylglycine-generating enzyme required for sulfatase activity